MLSYREMMETIHFATKHGQKEVKISEQYDRFIEHIVKLLAFNDNDSTNKWMNSVENVFRIINKQRIKGKPFSQQQTLKWLIEDNGLDISIIKNEIDHIIDNFLYKDIRRNNRTEKEIYNLIFKISKQILLNIQVGKYTINSTRIILLRYVTGV